MGPAQSPPARDLPAACPPLNEKDCRPAAASTRGGRRPGGWKLLPGAALLAAAMVRPALAAEALRVNGSTTVNPVVAEAAEILRAEAGMAIVVDTQGGSSGGIAALADGRAEVAMSSRPVSEDDRRKFPGVDFRSHPIGTDAVALVVSRDVWEGGVKALSREEMQGIYAGRIGNWRQLGGPDRRIAFFNKEPGRGTWEVFAHWLYGDPHQAPLVSFPEVGANEEARTKVASTRGALSPLSAAWADGERVFALGVRRGEEVVTATPEALAAGVYPISRPLLLVTDGEPRGAARRLLAFLRSPRGQELVRRHGYLTLAGSEADGERGGGSR